jgi:hypothetical protein
MQCLLPGERGDASLEGSGALELGEEAVLVEVGRQFGFFGRAEQAGASGG